MLKNLQLKNFKGWKDTTPIRMAPLTVFFGTNSSGKSSIEQFLLMLKQTVDSSDRKMVLFTGDTNTPVNLGAFEDLIFGRDLKNQLSFNFEWDLSESLVVEDPITEKSYTGNSIKFEAEIGMRGQKHPTAALNLFKYRLRKFDADQMSIAVERTAEEDSEYKLIAENYTLKRQVGRSWPICPNKFYEFGDQVSAYYQNADFVKDFSLKLEQLMRSIRYLGPLRNKGERLYNWSGGEPESVGYSGENTISALLASAEKKLNSGPKKRKRPFQEFIAEKLQKLELIEAFKFAQISDKRKEYEVKIKTPGSSFWVDLPDVGFGISQVLPVVVECFYAPPRSILFIEQPELHLHPRAQAHLADLFIDVITSRENGLERNVQLIIETHSEHFLLRLQRRIAEAKSDYDIKQEQVALYFAHTTGNQSRLIPLEVDAFGEISNWPENFFGDSMSDVFEKAKAASVRRQQLKEPK